MRCAVMLQGVELIAHPNSELQTQSVNFGFGRRLDGSWQMLTTEQHRRFRFKEEVYGARRLQHVSVLGVYRFFEEVEFECTMKDATGKDVKVDPMTLMILYPGRAAHIPTRSSCGFVVSWPRLCVNLCVNF